MQNLAVINQENHKTVSQPSCTNSLKAALSSYDYASQDVSFISENWAVPAVVSPQIKQEAKAYAVALSCAMMPVEVNAMRQWLATLGTLVAGQMSVTDAKAKMAALGEMLNDYPAAVFTKETLKQVAKKCKWLPSYSELCEVLDAEKAKINSMICRAERLANHVNIDVKCRPERREIPKSKWDAQHWDEYVEEAKNMIRLAENSEGFLNKESWKQTLASRTKERDAQTTMKEAA